MLALCMHRRSDGRILILQQAQYPGSPAALVVVIDGHAPGHRVDVTDPSLGRETALDRLRH
jgi:hypothetical protein